MLLTMAIAHAAPEAADATPGAKPRFGNNAYIVQMAGEPATAYRGGVAGYAATKPGKNKKIDPDSPAVVNYMAHLAARQDAALNSVGGAKKLYNYGYVFNGFAAELTQAQADKLAQTPGVLAVSKDELRELTTSSTPAFLNLSGTGGFWNTTGAKGEDVIIGVVDSGIWPEHPSFSDRTDTNGNGTKDGKLGYHQIPGWHGKCAPGDSFTGTDCNQKLIGARYYNSGFGGNAGIAQQFPFEFNSPRDWGGHGTHTASTSGGNAGVPATGKAAVFGAINGIAPRARIAVYKVCWATTPTGGGCNTSDSVAAIDQAVADGVDVINFSISGSVTNFRDPVEIAWLFAADAGVFIAASAGNSGPNISTVAHPSPWITTVAAGTHNRNGEGSVTIGAVYTGASVANAVGPVPSIDSTAAGLPGADPSALALCYAAADNGGVALLDPAKVAGKIVVCDRGGNARVNKSLAVKEAGGVGMVLVNTGAGSINADFHFVPTVHLPVANRAAVKAAAALGTPASIAKAQIIFNAPAPLTASFSSRGPALAATGDILKPDVIAPGQDILAGVAPPGNSGRLFDLYSGTSMSSPHVAGLAALFKQLYPSWSPMAIKSALMTTAGDVLDGPNTNPLVIFRQGAGHVRPNNATNPGLVFDSNFNDWLGFLCGTQLPASNCTVAGVPVLAPFNMNTASIALGAMAGSQVVKRRVTNVGGNPATYTASFSGLAGIGVSVTPASLTLAAGQTKEFTVTFTSAGAALNTYTGGQLTLSDGLHNVRVPVVIRPVVFAAPAEVSGSYSVKFGYSGAFSATPRGLVAATAQTGSIATGGLVQFQVTLPAGQNYARFSLFDSEVSQASDLDLVVIGPGVSGSSGGPTTAEEVNFVNPPGGVYDVYVQGYSVPTGSATFKLFSWGLDSTAAGNMTLTAPAAATVGQTSVIGISTSGLVPGTKYLGSVVYGGAAGLPAPTIVRINP